MKINAITICLLATLCWAACKSDNNQKSDQAKSEEALEALEIAKGGGMGAAAAGAQSALAEAAKEEAAAQAAPSPKPRINGSNVIMRKEASVKSEKLGSFSPNEEVEVLETKNVNNENEAILTQPIPLYANEDQSGKVAMTLPKGKAVVIEQYNADDNKYEVSYQMEGKGKLFAKISADAVETISYSTWYRVRRASGEEGWVLGKFLKTN
ncbi:MAG TPA: SH3 domain-containing protein [Saprospiraceae bacterium]|nr:SH3 domain-containing protein [Saprospiraceae bacterium]HND88349.1 SH3 domain-containing protein [Saprospiraceae bacterium]